MIDSILKQIYKHDAHLIHDGKMFDDHLTNTGYGETGYDSIEAMVDFFKDSFNNETVFYDLGSGVGKIVYHIGLKYNPKKACGIEYVKARHEFSQKLKAKYNIVNDNIIFINDNILNSDISDATFIYIDNTLFSNELCSLIYQKIPSGCTVISRKFFKESMINNEIIKNNFTIMTEYGVNTIYTFKKL